MRTLKERAITSALLLVVLAILLSACEGGQTGSAQVQPPSVAENSTTTQPTAASGAASITASTIGSNSNSPTATTQQTPSGLASPDATKSADFAGWLVDIANVDPCSLLTRQEVESIMGRPLNWNPNQYTSGAMFDAENKKMDQDLGRKSCVYEAPEASDTDPRGLVVQVWSPDTWWGIEWFDTQPESRVAAQDIGLGGQSVSYSDTTPGRTGVRAGQLPKVCNLELPCAVARKESTREFIFVILADWTSVGIRIASGDPEQATQLARKVVGRLLNK